MRIGYYWVEHYNHSKITAMYWNGEGFETFKSDPIPNDEIDFDRISPFVPLNNDKYNGSLIIEHQPDCELMQTDAPICTCGAEVQLR